MVDLDKNDIVYVMFVSVLLYFIYGNLFFSIFLLGIYFMLKKVNVSNRYRFVKNCLLYLVGFIVGILLSLFGCFCFAQIVDEEFDEFFNQEETINDEETCSLIDDKLT